MVEISQSLLPTSQNRKFQRCISHAQDELQSFRSCLKWMCVEQGDTGRSCLSWLIFILFTFVVPCSSHFFLSCTNCDSKHWSYDLIVQVSLSSVATLSFFCLSKFVKNYGMRRFMFFDKLYNESEAVRRQYTQELNQSLNILGIFVLPCFIAESGYKIWSYATEIDRIPYIGNIYACTIIACILELCSWLYRTSVFFFVCILFRLICHLQLLRLQDFGSVFEVESEVGSVLKEHLRIRRHLRIISHRYRGFILIALVLITGSQFSSLLITTRGHSNLTILRAGQLALCSITLLTGLFILFRSGTKITHKAQAVTCLAAKWHVCATIDSFDEMDIETPNVDDANDVTAFPEGVDLVGSDSEAGDEEDDVDNTKIIVNSYARNSISFQKRQALVTYFETNRAGITVYGFMVDRTILHTIFFIEMSLVLWLLGKTIGI